MDCRQTKEIGKVIIEKVQYFSFTALLRLACEMCT